MIKTAAIVTIKDASEMTKRSRVAIAKWIRKQADFLETENRNMSKRYTARYLYNS